MSKPIEVPANVGGVAAKQLQSIVDRIERLDAEIAGLNDDKRDIFAEVKANGWDVKALKIVLSERRKLEKNAEGFKETAEIAELYRACLGMGGPQMDMFRGGEE